MSQCYPSRPDLPAPKDPVPMIIAEYERLCAEAAELYKESANCVTFSLTSSAALWAWLLANPEVTQAHLIAWMPALLTALWLARWAMLGCSMGEIGIYLAETELLYFDGRHGWEDHLRSGGRRVGMRWIGQWKLGYFVVIMILNLIMAGAFPTKTEEQKQAEAKNKEAVAATVARLVDALTTTITQHKDAVGQPSGQ